VSTLLGFGSTELVEVTNAMTSLHTAHDNERPWWRCSNFCGYHFQELPKKHKSFLVQKKLT